jgi:AraC family transcriptional regulator
MRDLANLANLDYVGRINRAVAYVQRNLTESLQLEDVARVAAFSSFHFHRIFKATMGETLSAFVKRVRLERALYLLSHRDGATLTEIALACGFASSSEFSRSFRKRYGVAPRQFDLDAFRLAQRQAMETALTAPPEQRLLARLPDGANPDGFVVRFVERSARRVAYVMVQRPFEPGRVPAAAARLVAWAAARGLEGGQWLGYMWEEPEIVALERCHYFVGVEVPADVQREGEVGITEFAPMTLATIDLAGPIDLEMRAIDWLYATWLPTSGYVPDHQPAFEAWHGLPYAHGEARFELSMQLAVVDAATPL